MTEWGKKRGAKLLAGIWLFLSVFLLLPRFAFAKSITLTANASKIEIGEVIEVKIEIDTSGEKVNAVGFTIDFPTEVLEGLLPSQAGSVFPLCATLSATRYECGITGKDGFSGSGLVTTLIFKGRTVGTASVALQNFDARYGPTGQAVTGFTANLMQINVFPAGEKPAPEEETTTGSSSANKLESLNIAKPVATPDVQTGQSTVATPPSEPTTTEGSEPQVQGQKGAQAEEVLKPGDTSGSTASTGEVKGLFSAASLPYLSIFPTVLMLILVGFLGMKLMLTEKRRHLELERLFETEIGALAALESKLDLIDMKGGGGREKFLEEFEQTKNEIIGSPGSKNDKV
jgi:hypothetical protein